MAQAIGRCECLAAAKCKGSHAHVECVVRCTAFKNVDAPEKLYKWETPQVLDVVQV